MSKRGLSSSPYKSRLEKKKLDKRRADLFTGPKLRGRKGIRQLIEIEAIFEDVFGNPLGFPVGEFYARNFRKFLSTTL